LGQTSASFDRLSSFDRDSFESSAKEEGKFGGYRAIKGRKILSVFEVVPILTGFEMKNPAPI
jgi:hypothetical protein